MSSLLNNMIARLERKARRATPETNPLPEAEEHGENYLIDKVRSMDTKPEEARGGDGYIHGSSLLGICPRRYALTILSGTPDRVSVREQDRIMWAIGRAVEAHIRESFALSVKRKGIIGVWECPCGRSKREGEFSPTEKCGTCNLKMTKYRELAMMDHEYRIIGNPDLIYIRPDNHKVRIVEIKSKRKELFDALQYPEPNHILQALIYRRLCKINGLDVDESVSVIYGSKDYSFSGRPYKEFHIQSCAYHDEGLDSMWERAAIVRDYLADYGERGAQATLPEKITPCATRNSPVAKSCDQCQACFVR